MFALSLLASLAAAQPIQEIDMEGAMVESSAVRPRVSLIGSRAEPRPADCDELLQVGLADLPAIEDLDSTRARQLLRRSERSGGLEEEEESQVLARARICLSWRYGDQPRSTAGGYAMFVRRADVDYCSQRMVAYVDQVAGDIEDPTALDDAGVESELCLVAAGRGPLARNPFELAQTAFSEARIGRFVEGGAAEALYLDTLRKVDGEVTPEAFLATLLELDTSGLPIQEFVDGTSDRPWKPARIRREAATLLAAD